MYDFIGKIRYFLEFIRFGVCFLTAFLGAVGYLLFNSPDTALIYVYLASFLVCAGVYSHNNMTDLEEDEINRNSINYFSRNNLSYLLVSLFYFSGLFLSLYFKLSSFFPALLFVFLGVIYNVFRIKRYTLIKNLYTSFGVSLIFLIGTSHLSFEVLWYYVIIYIIFFVGSLISDIGDEKGDRAGGFKTLPVVWGEERVKLFITLLMLFMFGLVLLTHNFHILLPFEIPVLFLLIKNKIKFSHLLGGFSILFLSIWLSIF